MELDRAELVFPQNVSDGLSVGFDLNLFGVPDVQTTVRVMDDTYKGVGTFG